MTDGRNRTRHAGACSGEVKRGVRGCLMRARTLEWPLERLVLTPYKSGLTRADHAYHRSSGSVQPSEKGPRITDFFTFGFMLSRTPGLMLSRTPGLCLVAGGLSLWLVRGLG